MIDSILSVANLPGNEIDKALSYQRKFGGRIEQILVNMGLLQVESLAAIYAKELALPLLGKEELLSKEPAFQKVDLNKSWLKRVRWLPVALDENTFGFVTSDPLNLDANEIISSSFSDNKVYLCSQDAFDIAWDKFESLDSRVEISILSDVEESRLREMASEAPTINMLNGLIAKALRARSSDMHIEPVEGRNRVRFRIDGVLQNADSIPAEMVLPIITRLKILSGMDIAERRRPQDGKIEMRVAGMDIDIRVSSLPLSGGESIVMRFLKKESLGYDLGLLGLSSDIESQILDDLKLTSGVVLLTGPTGSGKTTSLYTFLSLLNKPGVKIITLEDPVEYQIQGINQVQVQPDIGFNFAAGLRSIVRQDPDVIMVGEIRDKETASIAMQSALTGHLVFSTVHTNDAPSAYTRLLELGVEEFLLNAALQSIVAQRLARKLCDHCKEVDQSEQVSSRYNVQNVLERFGVKQPTFYKPVGCEKCNHTGYRGRVAVVEYLRCDAQVKALEKNASFLENCRKLYAENGTRTLLEDGLLKAATGITTVEEVIRVAG